MSDEGLPIPSPKSKKGWMIFALAAGAVIVYVRFFRHTPQSAATVQMVPQSVTGAPAAPPVNPSGDPMTQLPASNQDFENQAVMLLGKQGVAPLQADATVQKYLSGQSLSGAEQSWMNQVIAKLGIPPQGSPQAAPPPAPTPVVSAPSPAPFTPAPQPLNPWGDTANHFVRVGNNATIYQVQGSTVTPLTESAFNNWIDSQGGLAAFQNSDPLSQLQLNNGQANDVAPGSAQAQFVTQAVGGKLGG